jgi:predicted NBD/HSP70 family sugar kinase
MSEPIIGLDVDGSKIAALLVDDAGRVIDRRLVPTDGECIELFPPDSDAGARGAVLVARAALRSSLP